MATITCDSRSRPPNLATSFDRQDTSTLTLVDRKYKLLVRLGRDHDRDLTSSPWGSRHSRSNCHCHIAKILRPSSSLCRERGGDSKNGERERDIIEKGERVKREKGVKLEMSKPILVE
ncbi:hypothetical protein TIFTF001_016664 [Ficus carica]|uniref:Uncharacterized protein n=1 Tax=Ficus carica TaxID=3494 RepID=A0AA88AAV4_FICCA|nr:hypothetical protein TIFTF001_016664 [Ficus carica]